MLRKGHIVIELFVLLGIAVTLIVMGTIADSMIATANRSCDIYANRLITRVPARCIKYFTDN